MKNILLFASLIFGTSFYSQGFEKGVLEENNRIELLGELAELSGIKMTK
jgi:hypothetical protein